MEDENRSAGDGPLHTLHVVSDATGSLARHMIEGVLKQFPDLRCRRVYHVYQGGWPELEKTLESIEGDNQLVVIAFRDPGLRRPFTEACHGKGIPCFDLLGSLLEFLAESTGSAPVYEVSRVHQVDREYLQHIQALEFTLQHDDSRRLETAAEADVIIVGVSRVGKTPTAVFLGSQGYRVANVTIVPERGFPREIEGSREKTIALTIAPERLLEIRNRRFARFKQAIRSTGSGDLPYYDLSAIRSEVFEAEEAYRRRGLPVLDITRLTVEEVAVKIIQILNVVTESAIYAPS